MFMHAVKYLLLLLMSAHGIFGCCWHHGHSCAADGDGFEVEVACHEDHHHGHEHQEGPQLVYDDDAAPVQESGHDEEACDEKACVYVHASNSEGQFQVASDLAFDHVFECDVQLSASLVNVFAMQRRFDRFVQTAGERCARFQTWLI